MFPEELETLVNAALADEVLTDKERAVLIKKATALGIDPDEFEILLDARILERTKSAAAAAPDGNQLGEVKRCPVCGSIVQQYQGVCQKCGYAFENLEANSSSEKLANLIASEYDKNRALTLIKVFPVPTTKTDLFEFITSLQSRLTDKTYGDAYKSKLDECVLKARLLFSEDKMMMDLVEEAEKELHKDDKRATVEKGINAAKKAYETINMLEKQPVSMGSGLNFIKKILGKK